MMNEDVSDCSLSNTSGKILLDWFQGYDIEFCKKFVKFHKEDFPRILFQNLDFQSFGK